jgi:hypothetical protein
MLVEELQRNLTTCSGSATIHCQIRYNHHDAMEKVATIPGRGPGKVRCSLTRFKYNKTHPHDVTIDLEGGRENNDFVELQAGCPAEQRCLFVNDATWSNLALGSFSTWSGIPNSFFQYGECTCQALNSTHQSLTQPYDCDCAHAVRTTGDTNTRPRTRSSTLAQSRDADRLTTDDHDRP